MTDPPHIPPDPVVDRELRRNEVAIIDVRREVAAAVNDIDAALARLREVLDTRLPELRQPEEGGMT